LAAITPADGRTAYHVLAKWREHYLDADGVSTGVEVLRAWAAAAEEHMPRERWVLGDHPGRSFKGDVFNLISIPGEPTRLLRVLLHRDLGDPITWGFASVAHRNPLVGSRAMRRSTPDVGLAIGESDQGPPAVLLLDLAILRFLRTRDDLRSAATRVESSGWVTPGALLGYIRLGYPKNEYGNVTCEDAEGREPLQVTISAAVPGWGPLLYDCALWVAGEDADNGFLIPDRGRVFGEAEAVWRHYIEQRRGEIVVRPVPRACAQYGNYDYYADTTTPHPYLDQMVRFRKNSRSARAIQPLFERGRDMVETLAERFGVDEDVVLADLVDLGEGFFSHRFDG
jgi:hypothetical protein